MTDAQKEFENTYFTSRDIFRLYKVDRSRLLYFRQRGYIPKDLEIRIPDVNLLIWKRAEIQPVLNYLENTGRIERHAKV